MTKETRRTGVTKVTKRTGVAKGIKITGVTKWTQRTGVTKRTDGTEDTNGTKGTSGREPMHWVSEVSYKNGGCSYKSNGQTHMYTWLTRKHVHVISKYYTMHMTVHIFKMLESKYIQLGLQDASLAYLEIIIVFYNAL